MTTPGAEIVPFGKYKGQPAEVLIADEDYRDWLTSQPWFRERYAVLYQTVINYGGEPQDSPEHNEMQVSFLDDQRCLRLACILYPSRTFDRSEIRYSPTDKDLHDRFAHHLDPEYTDAGTTNRTFENKGWDVTYQIDPASLALELTSMPLCTCPPCEDPLIDTFMSAVSDLHDDCSEQAPCQGGDGGKYGSYQCKHHDHSERLIPTLEWVDHASYEELNRFLRNCGVTYGKHCGDRCPWSDSGVAKWLLKDIPEVRFFQPSISGTIHVELKPDLGDDFPTVLRQVTNYDGGTYSDRRCVIARRHQFERVSWEQVTQMFKASGVVLLDETVLNAPELPR